MTHAKAALNAELLAWCRDAFRDQYGLEPVRVRQKPSEPLPDSLFKLACRHRMVGLLAAGPFPAWKPYAYGQAVHGSRCMCESERICSALRPHLSSLGLVKGSALAAQAWPQPGLRHFDDIDLRCAKQDIGSLLSHLARLGYHPVSGDGKRHANLWHFGWGLEFVNAEGAHLECNHRMFPPHYPCPRKLAPGVEGIWRDEKLDRLTVPTLTPSAHLLYGCLHAVWHGFERLSWIVDIGGLMMRHPAALGEARELAGEAGFARRALETACAIANAGFGPLPGWNGRVDLDSAAYHDVETALAGGAQQDTRCRALNLHDRLLNRREAIGYHMRRILTPGDGDFSRYSLPPSWRQAYWCLRPMRLAGDMIARLWPAGG